MGRLLARLERRLGRYAISNLTMIIAVGMTLAFLLSMARPRFIELLILDLGAVRHGQVWRLFTYLFIPPASSSGMFGPLWGAFAIYWFWLVGSNLETEWGAFKFNAFYFIGMLGTTLAAFLSGGGASNTELNLSLFLAFATLFPDYEILLFFILPIKVKWLGWLSAVGLVFSMLFGDWTTRAATIAATGNYVLFFWGHWAVWWRSRNTRVRQAARRAGQVDYAPQTGGRTCAICGAREADGADIRVCSCAKCNNTPRTLCLPHARNH